jgi:colanic acid biosynthesis glycosyl transferase WcaI
MAKILILTQFFPPETNAAANRIGAMADVLARKHKVEIITLNPSYPSPHYFSSKTPLRSKKPYLVNRWFSFYPHQSNLFVRGLSELLMSFRLAKLIVRRNPNLIIVSTPSMFLAPIVWSLSKFKSVRLVWDVRDITWRYITDSTGDSACKRLLESYLEKVMRSILVRTDLVIGATPGVTKILVEEHGVLPHKIITVVNGASKEFLDRFRELEHTNSKSSPIVSYVGLFGYNHGISILIDVAKELPGIQFVMVGDGPEYLAIENRIRDEKLGNISLLGYVTEREKLIDIYRKSDILISHIKNTLIMNETAIPAKLFEYMATGKPIVCAERGLAEKFLDDIGCAVIVPPEDPKAMISAIKNLVMDRDKMRRLGINGRLFVEANYQREKIMEQLLCELESRFSLK